MEKKRIDKSALKLMLVFLGTFLVVLLLVPYLAQILSPEIDVEIADEEVPLNSIEKDQSIKKMIDERLKWIQLEDNMPGVSKNINTPKDELNKTNEINDTPTKNKDLQLLQDEIINEEIQEHSYELKTEQEEVVRTNKESLKPSIPAPIPSISTKIKEPIYLENNKLNKVYIGEYTTLEEAIAAQSKLLSSGLNVSPYVKNINNTFVLQVGSFTSREKAENLLKELNNKGFPAVIKTE